MGFFKRIFQRKRKNQIQPLRVSGVGEIPMTAAPDDAELAAQALLDIMSGKQEEKKEETPEKGTSAYYHLLADRIRIARETSRLRTLRFLTFCEQELKKPDLPYEGPGSLSLLDAEIFKRIDTIEREGGDMEKRWQRCVAEITIRKMGRFGDLTENSVATE